MLYEVITEDAPSGFDTLSGYTASGRSTYSIFPLPTLGLTGQFNSMKDQFSSEPLFVDTNGWGNLRLQSYNFV